MSSSNPHKSHSGSVHDFNSKSSIEYVLIHSPMSLNIPLTTPIAFSMNLSGLNINMGIAMAQTFSTWSIPNISITPIPPNPTNTYMHVSEGPVNTSEISSKANPQTKFPFDFLLNPDTVAKRKTLRSQEPIEDCDQLHASSPLVHKEKVTGHHYSYTSKPRTVNASSSGEKIVDDEDENLSPNHSETNDEPRRDNFMAHEEGTQSN
ncbi:hypothetical protein O181_050259, partial [Austropuccinia psidii MF-1]|nr:hypothetical protein [Austropuccinia psidii MF-1]